jgi:hypothetical protein
VVVSFFLSMYYNVINAWGFWYLFHSFQVSHSPGQNRNKKEGGCRAAHLGSWGEGKDASLQGNEQVEEGLGEADTEN